MALRSCPNCKSTDISYNEYWGTICLICSACGFDERNELDQNQGIKVSQKVKGHYSLYKTGGSKRATKKIK